MFITKAHRGEAATKGTKVFVGCPSLTRQSRINSPKGARPAIPGSVKTSWINGRLALAAFLAAICFVLVIGHNSAFCGMAMEYQFPNKQYLFVYVLSVFFIFHCDIVRSFVFHPLCHLTD